MARLFELAQQEFQPHLWQVRTATKDEHDELVGVKALAGLVCIDGRKKAKDGILDFDTSIMRGKKLPGAVVMAAIFETFYGSRDEEVSVKDFDRACEKVRDNGLVPTMHNDPEGCAHRNAARQGNLGYGLPLFKLARKQVEPVLEKYDGRILRLAGNHVEERIAVLDTPGQTLMANGTSFIMNVDFARLALNIEDQVSLRHLRHTLETIPNHPTEIVIYER